MQTFSINKIDAAREILNRNGIDTNRPQFLDMLLGRMVEDCRYYLGFGHRNSRNLWAGNEAEQIKVMTALYYCAPERPAWVTIEDINNYRKQMCNR